MGEGEPDGEDGGVGVVCHPGGSHAGRGSDRHGVGARRAAATVLNTSYTQTGRRHGGGSGPHQAPGDVQEH